MSGEEPTDAAVAAEPPSVPPEELAQLRAELEAAGRRAADLLEQLKRARADYENLQRRAVREAEEVRETANELLLASLLPVLDDFEHSLAAMHGDAGEGLRMLHANLWKALADAGLEVLDPAGQPFDPYDHEVVGQANDEALSEGTVKEVVQKGYRCRQRLLRPAKVIVVKRGA